MILIQDLLKDRKADNDIAIIDGERKVTDKGSGTL